jgi:hypothetical protein
MYRHLQPILAASLLSMAAGTTNHAAEANVKSDQAATRARISDFLPARSVTRVGNPLRLSAQIANGTRVAAELVVRLTLPEGVSGREGALERTLGLEPVQEQEVTWEIEASTPQLAALRLEVSKAGVLQAEATVPVRCQPGITKPCFFL